MFTGKMPPQTFKREHPLDYNRLVAAGEREGHIVGAPSRPMTIGSQIVGFRLMAIGPILLVLTLVGSTRRLMGGG
jgi:hypothetical protein